MNVLVACEESQRVCTEFRKKGHDAFSCDIIDCSGGHPEWHIRDDVLKIMNGDCKFKTVGGIERYVHKWDMIIAFPPCTHLAVSGAKHFEQKRKDGRQREGIEFFCKIINADCEKLCVENPVNIISGGRYVKRWFPDLCDKYNLPIKPTQSIQPYEFGDSARKSTCLWLKGIEPLIPTDIVDPGDEVVFDSGKKMSKWYADAFKLPPEERAKIRSKTFPGIAKAMAEQWG